MPKGVQTILMSATLTTEVDTVKGLFNLDPVLLKLDEKEDDGQGVTQYVVKCAEDEKFLLIYVIFKLKLIKGKCIVFVQDIDRCYRLKLFLEQFGIKSCILNSELPVNSRIHVVEEFNKNVYDIIIASDEYEVIGDEEDTPRITDADEAQKDTPAQDPSNVAVEDEKMEIDGEEATEAAKPKKKKAKKQAKRDKEYGVSRGIDFKNVACVLNFDLPTTSKSYTHRIGRTGRAGQTGMALSFVVPADQYRKHKPTSVESAKYDEEVLKKIVRHQGKKGHEVLPYLFDMKQVEAFRYRMNDAIRAVTRVSVREARTRELRQELMKSEKLKRHFEENPQDLAHLRHDGELRAARTQSHLKHVPEYLLPAGGEKQLTKDVGFVGINKTTENRIRKARAANKAKGRGAFGSRAKRKDPLKSFRARTKGGAK
jgi:ATP-dependent RNA helicase DDX56/DBP9